MAEKCRQILLVCTVVFPKIGNALASYHTKYSWLNNQIRILSYTLQTSVVSLLIFVCSLYVDTVKIKN